MSMHSATILEPHFADIQEILFPGDGAEHAAYVLFGAADIKADPWTGDRHRKFISHEVVPVPESEVISNDQVHITWRMDSFVHILCAAKRKNMTVGVFHSHPSGFAAFSTQDNRNERHWIELAQNRNGAGAEVLSFILTEDGALRGRVWQEMDRVVDLQMVRVIGDRFRFYYPDRGSGQVAATFDRQALALGSAFSQDMSMLRIGIVGVGGTGSAANFVLCRMGPGYVAHFDKDPIDETNQSRLHGSTPDDVADGRLKVEIAKRVVDEMGLGTQVVSYPYWVDDPKCHDGLKSCDIIIACTDDNDGRIVMNQIPFYYGTPVIDVGLALEVSKTPPYRMLACDGRVTIIAPGQPCLVCREVVDLNLAREESLRRNTPEEYERLKKEAYVRGEGDPSPAVVFLTTEVATMAVQELVHRIQGFRGGGGSIHHVVRKFHLGSDRHPAGKSNTYCPVCGQKTSWGRGDDTRFLGLIDTENDDD